VNRKNQIIERKFSPKKGECCDWPVLGGSKNDMETLKMRKAVIGQFLEATKRKCRIQVFLEISCHNRGIEGDRVTPQNKRDYSTVNSNFCSHFRSR
jgi:hypothetical protein